MTKDGLIEVVVKVADSREIVGVYEMTSVPQVGDSLMLQGFGGADEGFTGWKVTEVYLIPRRAHAPSEIVAPPRGQKVGLWTCFLRPIGYPDACVFVDYWRNADVRIVNQKGEVRQW